MDAFFLTIALLTTDVFSGLWQNIREFPVLGVELHIEAPMTQLSPVRQRIPSHRIFCCLCFTARGYKPIDPDLQLSLLPRIQLWHWSRGTINCQTESRLWWKTRGRRKFVLRNCQGGCGMIDQVSVIMSQRLRKGTGKGKVVNLFLKLL